MCSAEDTYEYQFWDFSAKELSTGLENVVLETIQDVIDLIDSSLKRRLPDELGTAVSSSCQSLREECSHKAVEHLQIVKAYIKENFSIPPHVLLEEDSVQRQQYSDQERENIEQEIKALQRRIKRVHFMEFHLLQQLDKNKVLKTTAEKVKDLPIPKVDALQSRSLQHLVSECMAVEVEAASCHLKDGESDESGEFNQPNYALKVFKKKRRGPVP